MNYSLRSHASGFTMVEVLIVLGITSILTVSSLALFNERIPRTQFSSSVNNFNVQLKDISNQVVSGYYPNTGGKSCNAAGELESVPGGDEQGTSQECIFLGQAIQFGQADGSNCTIVSPNACYFTHLYTVYGKRMKDAANIATNLKDSEAKIANTSGTNEYKLGYGIRITKVLELPSNTPIGGVAFVQSFGAKITGSGQPSGSPQVNLVPLKGTALGNTETVFTNVAKDQSAPPKGLFSDPNPSQGILICLRGGRDGQYATVTVGAGGSIGSSDAKVMNQTEWSASPCV